MERAAKESHPSVKTLSILPILLAQKQVRANNNFKAEPPFITLP